MQRIYLDSNATTPMRPEVVAAMLPVFTEDYGNPSSIHWFGQQAKALLDSARQQVARLIHAETSEIVFVSGGTEADNMAIRGIAESQKARGRHIITTKIEHHAVLHTCRDLEKQGYEVTWLGVSPDGVVNPEDVRRAIRPDTILISIMHANNEIGTIQPIEEIGKGSGQDYGKTDPETGQAYYGRGFVQLTWRDNYAKADVNIDEEFGIDPNMEWEAENALVPPVALASA